MENNSFDPNFEFEKLVQKGRSQEGFVARLQTFKEKMMEQKQQVYEATEKIYGLISEDADSNRENIYEIFEELKASGNLSDDQIKEFEEGITSLLSHTDRVSDISKEKMSDLELFQEVVGTAPTGQIRVEFNSLAIIFYCEKEEDLIKAYRAIKPQSSLTEEEINEHLAFSDSEDYSNKLPKKYQGLTIFALEEADDSIIAHEIDHKRDNIYTNTRYANHKRLDRHIDNVFLNRFEPLVKKAEGDPSKLIELYTSESLHDYLPFLLVSIKNELSAHLMQGLSLEQIEKQLTKTGYLEQYAGRFLNVDFLEEIKKFMAKNAEGISKDQPGEIEILEIVSKVAMEMLNRELRKMLSSVEILLQKSYSRERISTILHLEPAEDLSKIAKRLPTKES